jgi:N-acetylglucosamine-6-phosphate deacetylase
MAVAGTELDAFTLNGREILRRGGRLTLADGTLAGADLDFATAVRVLVETGATLGQALRMATAAPAAAIGIGDRLGRLAPGLPADLVHLDDDGLALAGVWRAGRAVEMRP